MIRYILAFLILVSTQVKAQSSLVPDELTCEYRKNPLGIDISAPRLSWTLYSNLRNQVQTAYEIQVAITAGTNHERITIWKSGKVISGQNIQIVYKGPSLHSCTRYYWKVRIYDRNNRPSNWSKTSWFETAILNPEDWKARWIGDKRPQFSKDEDFYKVDPMPLFKKRFKIRKDLYSARLYISGLGYYEAFLNGNKIGQNVLDPGFTKYSKQVLYSTYDVTELLKTEDNQLNVILGNGWYNPLPLRLFGQFNLRNAQQTGRPCLKAQLYIQYKDGRSEWILSDTSWRTQTGAIVRNNVYLGEAYDARLEVPELLSAVTDNWENVIEVPGPSGILSAQSQPPIQIKRIIEPKSIRQLGKDTFIVDMGETFAGVAHIKVRGLPGTTVKLKYGEALYADGSLNYMTTVAGHIKEIWNLKGGPGSPKTAWQEDTYTLKGRGLEDWAPKFTFHSFRYIQITGWPGIPQLDNIEGFRMNANLQDNGNFECSNNMFNRLDTVIKRTFLSNVFSVQSDCPGREKLGYGADIVTTSSAYLQKFNMANFYAKTVRDFANDQQPDGGITEIAPYNGIADHGYGGDSGPLGWELAFSFVQKQLYDYYGDKRIITTYYPAFVKQMDFLQNKSIHDLFDKDISDHASLDPKPEAFTASAFYYHHALLAAEFASILNKKTDQQKYLLLAEKIKKAILKKFYHPESGKFDNGTQAAQIFGLWYNFAPDKAAAFKVLLKDYETHHFHLTTGIFATRMLFDVLEKNGRSDVAYRIANQRDYPGWGYMLEKGATTLWESWQYPDNATSQNHPMFGSIAEWFYKGLLGINSAAPGFTKILIKPQPLGDLNWAKGNYRSAMGNIVSEWQKNRDHFSLHVVIPANTTAEIWIPTKLHGKITENGIKLTRKSAVKLINYKNGYAILRTGSGDYHFIASL